MDANVNTERREVSSVSDLQAAAADGNVRDIVIFAPIADMPVLRLSHGRTLSGVDGQSALRFAPGCDGLELSADNRGEGLRLIADTDRRVVFNDTGVEQLGRLVLRALTVESVGNCWRATWCEAVTSKRTTLMSLRLMSGVATSGPGAMAWRSFRRLHALEPARRPLRHDHRGSDRLGGRPRRRPRSRQRRFRQRRRPAGCSPAGNRRSLWRHRGRRPSIRRDLTMRVGYRICLQPAESTIRRLGHQRWTRLARRRHE